MDNIWFRFESAVDWLVVEIRTLKPRVAWRLQKASAGAFSYVVGLDLITGEDIEHTGQQGKNTPTTRFSIRIQNPERFHIVRTALEAIKYRDPLAAIMVRGIEVAFDAYRLPGTTNEQLAEMVAIMLHAINRPVGTNSVPRLYNWRCSTELRYGRKSLKAAILGGKTAMYGNKDDDYIIRGYLKDYDTQRNENGKDQRVTIADNLEHRARIEVRLQGKRCPVRTLDDLKDFKFESLARPYFKFCEPANDLKPLEALVAGRAGSLGSVIDEAGKVIAAHGNRGRPRKTNRNSEASSLNEKARDKLRDLSLRWLCKSGRSRRRPYENSGSKGAADHAPNYLNGLAPQRPEGPCHTSEINAPTLTSTALENDSSGDAVLNTSLRATDPLATYLANPIKVVCGITPSADLYPLINNLRDADCPPLPDLT